jgi:hypothetical protein
MENEVVATETAESTATEVSEAQSYAAETEVTEAPAQTEGSAKVSDSDRLKSLIEISKDPKKADSLSDSDLDFLEKHDFGAKPPKEDKKDEAEAEAETKEETGKPDPALAEALKEVGAKDAKELADKIKGLKKQLTGKDAQTVTRLTKDLDTLSNRVKNEMALFEDVRAGKPQAIAHLEKTYGLKLAQGSQSQAPAKSAEGLIPRDAFIDPESADMVNGVVQRLQDKIDALEGGFKEQRAKETEATAKAEAMRGAVDEMVTVSGLKGMEEIAGIPNLRKAIEDWYGGKDNPRLEVFSEVLNLANERTNKGLPTDLEAAWAILYARGADLKIAKAKAEGRAEAYNQKPSKSLSGIQGKGHQEYKTHTDAQLKEMSEDLKLCPDDWFDKDDRPDPKKIPARAHKYFFPENAR